MTAKSVILTLYSLQNPAQAIILQRFFKTWPSEYGEWDVFLGIKVPETRKVAKQYKKLPLTEIQKLLESPYHEARLCGLLILVSQFQHEIWKKWEITSLYLANTSNINSRDLVDLSAPNIVGNYYFELKDSSILDQLSLSNSLRERRISIVSTFYFIKKWQASDTLRIAETLLTDQHDLIQKAVWWMLREVYKRVDEKLIYDFLDLYATEMPRTMLRYTIERFPEPIRLKYLHKKMESLSK